MSDGFYHKVRVEDEHGLVYYYHKGFYVDGRGVNENSRNITSRRD